MSAAGSRHVARVKQLPCGVCGAPAPSAAHHVRTGQGMSQRAGDFCTIPLCWEHHQGTTGIHGDRSAWRLRKLTEMDVLDDTIGKLCK